MYASVNLAIVRIRILLVEDNPGDADLVRERLAEAPTPAFDVARVATLAQAIHLLARESVDAIILDLNLPDSRGIDTVRRIRIVLGTTPIIVVSGEMSDDLRIQAISEGAEDMFAKDETNNRLFWRSIVQIIDRRREQLEHRYQFQRLLDAMPDAIVVVNHAGLVRYVNQTALELFVRSRDNLLREGLGFPVRDEGPTEIAIRCPDGEKICEMRVVSMNWADEQSYLTSLRDITENKRTETLLARSGELESQNRRLVEASRLKSEFLANMSHELRTPLNSIIGFSSILYDGLVDAHSPQYKEFLGDILAAGEHLLHLINDILDLTKVEAGKIRFYPERVDLSELIHEVVTILGALSKQSRVHVGVELDASLTDVQLDPGRFKQVLYNYISNALKFSQEGAQVVVRTKAEGDAAFRVEVEDTGVGIALHDIGTLFTEFHQLETGLAKRHAGAGLGLALTKRLVEAQGGTVGVSSAPGRGSVFFATLPRVAYRGDLQP